MKTVRKAMIFVDGENLVFRYQAILAKGRTPHADVVHSIDEYVWRDEFEFRGMPEIIRAYYYTSITGDQDKIISTEESLKALKVLAVVDRVGGEEEYMERNLHPVVFRKPKKAMKSKGVDIQMTVDILMHAFRDNIDSIYLFSGDGDYKPVLEEAVRLGKNIHVGAFSDGLNPVLPRLADEFIDLDKEYFV